MMLASCCHEPIVNHCPACRRAHSLAGHPRARSHAVTRPLAVGGEPVIDLGSWRRWVAGAARRRLVGWYGRGGEIIWLTCLRPRRSSACSPPCLLCQSGRLGFFSSRGSPVHVTSPLIFQMHVRLTFPIEIRVLFQANEIGIKRCPVGGN